MKKILSLLLLAAAALGTFLALGGCAGSSRANSSDCADDCIDGGVTRSSSYDAPKAIRSAEIVALDMYFFLYDEDGGGKSWSFAVRREDDKFLLSLKKRGRGIAEKTVGKAFLSEMNSVIMKHDLARISRIVAMSFCEPRS